MIGMMIMTSTAAESSQNRFSALDDPEVGQGLEVAEAGGADHAAEDDHTAEADPAAGREAGGDTEVAPEVDLEVIDEHDLILEAEVLVGVEDPTLEAGVEEDLTLGRVLGNSHDRIYKIMKKE